MDWMNRYERWLHSCGDEPELLEELRAEEEKKAGKGKRRRFAKRKK